MASFISQVATSIKGISLKISARDMDKCFGQTAHFIKAIGREEFRMEKVKFILWEEKSLAEFSKIAFLLRLLNQFIKNKWKFLRWVFKIYSDPMLISINQPK
jgi:hypothetical protein